MVPYVRINGTIALHVQLPGIESKIELFGVIKKNEAEFYKNANWNPLS